MLEWVIYEMGTKTQNAEDFVVASKPLFPLVF